MTKAMKYRDLVRAMKAAGCTSRQGKGDHEVWTCPCGQHQVVITQTTIVSPGIVRQAVQRLSCLPKGWI